MLTTWQALPEDSAGLCAWWCLQGFGVPPRTETTTPRPSLTRDPSQRAKSFAQNGEGLKTSLGWRVQPIFPFCVGRDGFPPICPCPHEGRYTKYGVLVWLTLRGKKFRGVQNCHYIRRGLKPRGRGRPLQYKYSNMNCNGCLCPVTL